MRLIRAGNKHVRVRAEGGETGKFLLPHSLPSPFLWPSLTPLVLISLSPQPSAAVKIKDGSYNFHRESTRSPKLGLLCRLMMRGNFCKFEQALFDLTTQIILALLVFWVSRSLQGVKRLRDLLQRKPSMLNCRSLFTEVSLRFRLFDFLTGRKVRSADLPQSVPRLVKARGLYCKYSDRETS